MKIEEIKPKTSQKDIEMIETKAKMKKNEECSSITIGYKITEIKTKGKI